MLRINTFVDYGVSPLNFRLGCDDSELSSFTLKRGKSKQISRLKLAQEEKKMSALTTKIHLLLFVSWNNEGPDRSSSGH